jgi:hypothetical protein
MRDALNALGLFIAGLLVCWALYLALQIFPAAAHWKPEYASATPAVRDWYESRELTPAAEARFHFKSCCNNSDVVQAKFAVSKVASDDQWFYQRADGPWHRVPADIIHWDEHAPDGRAVMFALGDQPTCFYPPGGGL